MRSMRQGWTTARALVVVALAWAPGAQGATDAAVLAQQATIHRDEWGVPHIEGTTDEACVFGLGYAQAEDYFWQIEEVYLRSIGRHAEMVGEVKGLQFWPEGVAADVLSRAFEVAKRSQADFAGEAAETRMVCEAYAAGINHFLSKNPEVKPAVIEVFEPWMVLAMSRFTMLEWAAQRAGYSPAKQQQAADAMRKEIGSNFWAIGPSRTQDKTAMLFVNPHQPFFGPGQFWEAHVKSGSGWNFSGTAFYGSPVLSMGHNGRLGWAHTANQPDVGDTYKVIFDDPANPLNYRYDGGYRTAVEWKETIRIKTSTGFEDRSYTFRKTHHGPIIEKIDDQTYLACRVANIFEGDRIGQAMRMSKAQDFDQWIKAVSEMSLVMFNIAYADQAGNIYYLYNGAVPKRDPGLVWDAPMDGTTSKTEWKGMHAIAELPQMFNPATGFIQNCNTSPFTTSDDGNPYSYNYPKYMVQEGTRDNRRAIVSRWHLRDMHDMTFDGWAKSSTDSTVYWAEFDFPNYAREFEALKTDNPALAETARPYFEYLLEWDKVIRIDDAHGTLAYYWYEEMHGMNPPPEKIKPEFIEEPGLKFEALVTAAKKIESTFGNWKTPYGDVFRLQRHANVSNYLQVPFSDGLPSVPSAGTAGALGSSNNTYFSFSTPARKMRYAVQGGSFMAVYEFGERVKARSVLQFGNSGNANSPHFFDQAQLYSKQTYKDAWFYWEDVLAHTKKAYHPGEEKDR